LVQGSSPWGGTLEGGRSTGDPSIARSEERDMTFAPLTTTRTRSPA